MSFFLSFHLALLGPTGAHWLDGPSDLSCNETTRQHAVDDPLLSCKQQVGVESPRQLPEPQVTGLRTCLWVPRARYSGDCR
jgi:hypothetical protein